MNQKKTSSDPIGSTIHSLAHLAQQGLLAQLERIRIARIGYALFYSGCSPDAPFPGTVLASYLIKAQQGDGGWADTEETLWCLGYLSAFDDKYKNSIIKGINWLKSVRLPCEAWGRSVRDQPRIPITALASALVPQVISTAGLEWLASQWEADLSNPTQLTYKGAFFLLSQAHDRATKAPDLAEQTIVYLCKEQEKDGGFSPWKGHPVGPDPWTTGIVLWGLSRFVQNVPPGVIERAANWLQSTQLQNGLWPYHYLDDGMSMALIGLSSVLPILYEN